MEQLKHSLTQPLYERDDAHSVCSSQGVLATVLLCNAGPNHHAIAHMLNAIVQCLQSWMEHCLHEARLLFKAGAVGDEVVCFAVSRCLA